MLTDPRSRSARHRDPSYSPPRLSQFVGPSMLGDVSAKRSRPTVASAHRRATKTNPYPQYGVRYGDTTKSIAAKHGISVESLIAHNPRKAIIITRSGRPAFKKLTEREKINIPRSNLPGAVGNPHHAHAGHPYTTHIVRYGTTPSQIAAMHNISVADLIAANSQKRSRLSASGMPTFVDLVEGERINIPAMSRGVHGGRNTDIADAVRAIRVNARMQQSGPALMHRMNAMAGVQGTLGAGAGSSCSDDSECDSYNCLFGFCAPSITTGSGPPVGGGTWCNFDAECGAGQTCSGNQCVSGGGGGTGGGTGQSTAGCASDDDCASGEACDQGACVAQLPSGGGCSVDDDCASDETCSNGVCAPAAQNCASDGSCGWGTSCSQDSDCDSKNCFMGYCAPNISLPDTGDVITAPPPDTTGPGGGANCFADAQSNNDCAGCVDPSGQNGNCMGGNCIQTTYCQGTPKGPPPKGGGGTGGGTKTGGGPGGTTTTTPGWRQGDACGTNAHVGASLQCFCDTGYTWAGATGTDCTLMTGTGGTKTGGGPGGTKTGGGPGTTPPPRGGPGGGGPGGGGPGGGGGGPGGKGSKGPGGSGTTDGGADTGTSPWLYIGLGVAALAVAGGGGYYLYTQKGSAPGKAAHKPAKSSHKLAHR